MRNFENIISVLQADITRIATDAIVNAANSSLLGGGGVDGAIHRAGGPSILAECRMIIARQGSCKTGEAVITSAGNLPSKFVIHTVGPVWNGGKHHEEHLLANCYHNSLSLATQHGCRSITFPNISTGIYRFPKHLAASIAVDTIVHYKELAQLFDRVIFACFDEENFILTSNELKTRNI